MGTGSQGGLLLSQPHGCKAAVVPCPQVQVVERLSTHSWWLHLCTHTTHPSSHTGRCREKALPFPAPTFKRTALRWTWTAWVAQSCSSCPADQDWSLLVQYGTWYMGHCCCWPPQSLQEQPPVPLSCSSCWLVAPTSPRGSQLTPSAGTQTSHVHQLVWVKVC